MKKEFEKELSPEVREKMRKNLVYVSIFSIIMLFAGLTSAYIVSMGDSFWLKTPLPNAFWISTTIIILSSISIEYAVRSSKNKTKKGIKIGIILTLLLGFSFVYFQFKGYSELIDNGVYATQNHILVNNGRYGEKCKVKINDQDITVNGNTYFLNGREIKDSEYNELKIFMNQFLNLARKTPAANRKYKSDNKFKLFYNNNLISFKDGNLYQNDTLQLQYTDLLEFYYLAAHISANRGDFYVKGEIGKDFNIYFKGEELSYKNRQLYRKGNSKPLPKHLQRKAIETADSAASYLYILTFVHLLHILVSCLYLIRLSVQSFKGEFDNGDFLKLRLGSIFWHFFGFLWLYLVVFLLFIH